MAQELDTVKFARLQHLVEQIEKEPHLQGRLEDTDVSFEFLMGSLFPSILENVHDALAQEHTKGYAEGIGAKFNIEQLYHLSCDKCNTLWWSDIAFPEYCPCCGEKLK